MVWEGGWLPVSLPVLAIFPTKQSTFNIFDHFRFRWSILYTNHVTSLDEYNPVPKLCVICLMVNKLRGMFSTGSHKYGSRRKRCITFQERFFEIPDLHNDGELYFSSGPTSRKYVMHVT